MIYKFKCLSFYLYYNIVFLTRHSTELIILPVLFCFLPGFVRAQVDSGSHWQIYLNDSLLISDNMSRLSLEQKPLSVILPLQMANSENQITLYYYSGKPSKNRQQLYIARKDSVRLTQRFFKPNKRLRISVRDLLYFQQDELWLYYSNDYLIKPSRKPYGHVIARIHFQ